MNLIRIRTDDDHPQADDPPGLSLRDWLAIFKRAGKEVLDDDLPMVASALAYSSFLAIPASLLVVTGVFTLVAGAGTIDDLVGHVGRVAPKETVTLLDDSLRRLDAHPTTGLVMTIAGFAIALWATTGAMTSLMAGLNIAYDRRDSRGFLRRRLVALQLTACIAVAALLVFGLLVLGPHLSRWVGDATGTSGFLGALWWAAQWPILVVGVLAAFATMLRLGPDLERPTWRLVTPGAVAAVVIWLAASGLFAAYTSMFGSYDKTWGSLAAVIVMLTWLWLGGLALLFGAELNAEAERCRGLRRGTPVPADQDVPA